ncbi:MAG: homocysteine S-methyltransferase [Nocardioides sp.]|nr:homocysteine S-methyltransferase [Nocardioides sp.]
MSVTVLDGGLSNALEARGHDVSGHLWTARVLADAPEDIAVVHRQYFEAGADVATTASYQASVPGFVDAGMSRPYAEQLLRRSVRIARAVASEAPGRLVAASVGPYGAYLADGSEYRGRYGVPARVLHDFHAARLAVLETEEPDLIAVETIPDIDEAEVLVELLDDIGLPVWFSYSCAGLSTRAGQPLADAFALAAEVRSIVAVGVNCCDPADVPGALELVAATGEPAVAYPNSGEGWSDGTWTGGAHFTPAEALAWVRAGAAYVGGCCRVGPADIAALHRDLSRPDADLSEIDADLSETGGELPLSASSRRPTGRQRREN